MGIYDLSQEATTPESPSSNRFLFYPKSDGFYYLGNDGQEIKFADIANKFGDEFTLIDRDDEVTNNTNNYQDYLSGNWNGLDYENGTYRGGVKVIWGMSTTSSSFKARILIGGNQFGREFYKETKDATDENVTYVPFYIKPGDLTQSGNQIQLQYGAENNGNTATMYEAFIELWRIS